MGEKYRSIQVRIWGDDWFQTLEPDAKLLFLYACTNRAVSNAGVAELTVRTIAFETGLSPEAVERGLRALAPKVVWWPESNRIWVRNHYRHQCATNRANWAKSAVAALENEPDAVVAVVVAEYPELAGVGGAPPDSTPSAPTSARGGSRSKGNRDSTAKPKAPVPAQADRSNEGDASTGATGDGDVATPAVASDPAEGSSAPPRSDLDKLTDKVGEPEAPAPKRERPNDIIAGLKERLEQLDGRWKSLTWPAVQKLINDYGARTVTEVLQHAWETRLIPVKAPVPLLKAMCERQREESA